MTPREADRIIARGEPVRVRTPLDEPFVAIFVRRSRWNIETADGALFDRGDLEIVEENGVREDEEVTRCR